MKKVILWIAIILVAFIPLYILIFSGVRSAMPEVYLGTTELTPFHHAWRTDDTALASDYIETEEFYENLQKIASVEELKGLSFSREPADALITIIDTVSGNSETIALADLVAGTAVYTPSENSVQIILLLRWDVLSKVDLLAGFSFEVNP